MTTILLGLIWIFSLLGQFERVLTPLGRLSVHEIFMAIFIVYSGTFWLHSKKWFGVSRPPAWTLWLCGFFIWTILTTLLNAWWLHSTQLLVVAGSYLFRLILYLGFGWAVWFQHTQKRITSAQLFLALWSWLVLQALFGVFQYLVFPDTRLFKYLGWDDHLSRAFGTLFDPGFFGLICVFGALVSISLLLKRKSFRLTWWMQQLGLVISLAALALSFSRASYVAFLVGIGALALLLKQKRLLLFFPLLVMVLFLLPKDGGGEGQKLSRTNSIEAREEVLSYHARNITWKDMVLGRGWYYESVLHLHEAGLGKQELPEIQNAQSVDMLYAHIFFSTGIVGTLFFSGFLFTFWGALRGKPLSKALLGSTLAHSIFAPSLLYPWVLLSLISLFVSDEALS